MPVVRISPNSVHVNNPDFFDELYNVAGRLDKDARFYRMPRLPQSTFQTTSPELHRVRWKPISKFFSSAAMSRPEAIVNRNPDTLVAQLDQYKLCARPINMSDALRCLTTDTISEYVLPSGPNLLDRGDFAAVFNQRSWYPVVVEQDIFVPTPLVYDDSAVGHQIFCTSRRPGNI